jgi:hypothetical protein
MPLVRAASVSCPTVFFASLLALGACGDDSGSSEASSRGSESSGSDSSGNGSGGASSSASDGTGAGEATGGGAPNIETYGSVGLYSNAYVVAQTSVMNSGAFAGYFPAVAPPAASPCTSRSEGECTFTRCTIAPSTDPGVEPIPSLDAGAITVTGANRSIALTHDGMNYTFESSSSEGLYEGGESLTFAVAGSDLLPAVQGTLVAPDPVSVTSPDVSAPFTIDRSNDFTLSWSEGTNGQVAMYLSTSRSENGQVVESSSVRCSVPLTDNQLVVPASLLADMLPTGPTDYGSLNIETLSESVVVEGTTQTTFRATSQGKNAAGGPGSTQIFLP